MRRNVRSYESEAIARAGHERHISLTYREHGVAARSIRGGDFLLQHIPVFHHFAVLDAEEYRRRLSVVASN